MERPAQASCTNCEDENAECVICGTTMDDDEEMYCNGSQHICMDCFDELQLKKAKK
jgi:hypothetical protein